MDAIKMISQDSMKAELPQFSIGDTVRVDVNIREGDRERIQQFEGTVIARKGSGISETFTVRRVSYGVGVERVFPMHSPNVKAVQVVRQGRVRRAKLYYLRNRVVRLPRLKNQLNNQVVETGTRDNENCPFFEQRTGEHGHRQVVVTWNIL